MQPVCPSKKGHWFVWLDWNYDSPWEASTVGLGSFWKKQCSSRPMINRYYRHSIDVTYHTFEHILYTYFLVIHLYTMTLTSIDISHFFEAAAVHHLCVCVSIIGRLWRLMYKGSIAVEKARLLNLGDVDVDLLGEPSSASFWEVFQKGNLIWQTVLGDSHPP